MENGDWLQLIFLGGTAGLLGQGIRAAMGIQKAREKAKANKTSFSEVFSPSEFVTGLLVAFTAGALAAMTIQVSEPEEKFKLATVLGFVAAGYAGTDFIEGFAKRFLPSIG